MHVIKEVCMWPLNNIKMDEIRKCKKKICNVPEYYLHKIVGIPFSRYQWRSIKCKLKVFYLYLYVCACSVGCFSCSVYVFVIV
jgi:hypothetical protein